jgi:hypothetical protein
MLAAAGVAGAAVVVAAGVVAVLAMRGDDSGAAVADCYSGSGTTSQGERLVATLRLAAAGERVSGTYVAGATTAQGLAYDVQGRLAGGRFDGTFTAAGQAVAASGTMDRDRVVLDGGRGFAITRFDAGGSGC